MLDASGEMKVKELIRARSIHLRFGEKFCGLLGSS